MSNRAPIFGSIDEKATPFDPPSFSFCGKEAILDAATSRGMSIAAKTSSIVVPTELKKFMTSERET